MPNVNEAPTVLVGNITEITCTIEAGETESSVVFCSGNSFLALEIDGTFTPGNIVFLANLTGAGTPFYQITDQGVDFIMLTSAAITTAISTKNTLAEGIQIPLDANNFAGAQFLKIVCSVAQATDQRIKIVMGPVLGS